MDQRYQYLGKILGDDDETIVTVPVAEVERTTLTIREWYEENERTPFYDEIKEKFEAALGRANDVIAEVERLCKPATHQVQGADSR